MPVIGYLDAGSPGPLGEPFRKGLSEAGYVEGRNVAIDYRAASNDLGRLVELARDLVRRRVAVIVADGSVTAAADAVKAANSTMPIVFYFGGDPVERGFVASLNRHEGTSRVSPL
jgi:putative ABC transport system substrate-binding protein